MTTWEDFRTAVKAAVRTAAVDAGIVNAAVAWGDEARPAAGRLLLLDVVSAVSLHDRDTLELAAEQPPSGAPVTTWALSSLFDVKLQVRTETHNAAPGADGLFLLERVRASLHRPGLVIAGAALEWPETQAISRVSFVSDQRVLSSYSFEVSVRTVLDFAPEDEAGGTLAEVVVEGESTTPDDDSPAITELDILDPD